MKRPLISISIILFLSSLFLLPPVEAQEKKRAAFYQGTSVGAEVFGLMNKALGSDFKSAEAIVQINLKNRYMPVAEIGYGTTDVTNDKTNIHYKAASPYVRIGMDYNTMHKKPHLPGYIFVGGRIGHTSFAYDVDAPDLQDPIWKGLSIPFAHRNVKTNVTWIEIVVGVKTHILKGFHMGWSMRYRSRLNMKENENSAPYYVPGFGKNGKSSFGLTYHLTYHLPF